MQRMQCFPTLLAPWMESCAMAEVVCSSCDFKPGCMLTMYSADTAEGCKSSSGHNLRRISDWLGLVLHPPGPIPFVDEGEIAICNQEESR